MPSRRSTARPQIGMGTWSTSPRTRELVLQVLDSGRLSAGPMMSRFEQAIAEAHGCRYGLMCNSGTSALQIALAALKEVHGWQDGDEVVVPAVTFVATSNVVLYNGLKPVFVDVEPDYYMLDPAQLEQAVTERTRAVVPVHLAGLPCDMDPILEITRRHGLRMVEDSAETMFSRYGGRPVGSFGDIGCFSTYVAHLLVTGVGGLCTTNDPDLHVILKSLMNHGRDPIYTRIDDDQGEDVDLFEVAEGRFSYVRLGHSFRATELEAALGVAEFERREASLRRRLEVAGRLTEGLADLSDVLRLPQARPGSEHAFMFYPLTLTSERHSRDDLIRHLEERAIETRYLMPLINQPIYRELFGDLEPHYPVAAHLNRNGLYIGCHPGLTDDDVDYVLAAFHEFFGA